MFHVTYYGLREAGLSTFYLAIKRKRIKILNWRAMGNL
jgi:hypothetical protein